MAQPLVERLATTGALDAVAVLVVRGSRGLWPERQAEPWTLPLIGGALLIFTAGGLRLVASDGAELSGRASTFVYIPVALVAAIVLCDVRRRRPGHYDTGQHGTGRRGLALLGRATPVVAAAVILMGGVAGGWPPTWDRLPGPSLAAGFERSVDPQGVAAAEWARRALGPGHRWAADHRILLAGHDRRPDHGARRGVLFDGKGADAAAGSLVQREAIQFLAVDLRDSRQLPASGAYFPVDPNAGGTARRCPGRDLEAPSTWPASAASTTAAISASMTCEVQRMTVEQDPFARTGWLVTVCGRRGLARRGGCGRAPAARCPRVRGQPDRAGRGRRSRAARARRAVRGGTGHRGSALPIGVLVLGTIAAAALRLRLDRQLWAALVALAAEAAAVGVLSRRGDPNEPRNPRRWRAMRSQDGHGIVWGVSLTAAGAVLAAAVALSVWTAGRQSYPSSARCPRSVWAAPSVRCGSS